MTYEDYQRAAHGYVAGSRASWDAAEIEPTTHYQRVTDAHGNVVAWLPVADTEPPTPETWRDRAPLL